MGRNQIRLTKEGSQKEILAISNCCLEVLNSFLTIFWLFGYLKIIFGPLKRTLSPLPDINHSTLPSYFNPKVKGSLITRFSPNAQQTVSVKFELRPFQFWVDTLWLRNYFKNGFKQTTMDLNRHGIILFVTYI